MPSTISLIDNLQADLPGISFTIGDDFRWSPKERRVYYANLTDTASLIHEAAHAHLCHSIYAKDIELIGMERDAWDYAVNILAKRYGITIEDDTVQDSLDTYRNWLHARSTCPGCSATGVQTSSRGYSCLACSMTWRVNEARSCALRRYTLSTYKNSR